MGDYLKQQYKERDLARTLAKVHGLIDEETQKLSDRVKNLTLSHNRMRKLLKMSKNLVEQLARSDYVEFDLVHFHKLLTLELYGLENYSGLVIKGKIVEKGVKNEKNAYRNR